MRAVRYSRFGPAAEVAEVVELPDPPTPAEGEVIIGIEAMPINPADLLRMEGKYGNNPALLPGFAGAEGTGKIVALGAGVKTAKVGDRVLVHQSFMKNGAWRERHCVSAESLILLPDADVQQMAMIAVNPATAAVMLEGFVTLRAGEWIIQNAANSAVGRWLIKLAVPLGLSMINVVRREDVVADLTAFGGKNVIVDGPDLAERVDALTENRRPRLAIDAIGGEATQRLAASVAEGGTVVNYGLLSGEACRVAAHDTVFRDVTLRGFWLQRWWNTHTHAEIQALYDKLTRMIKEGTLSVPVEATYPLASLKKALEHAARDGRGGKIIITM